MRWFGGEAGAEGPPGTAVLRAKGTALGCVLAEGCVKQGQPHCEVKGSRGGGGIPVPFGVSQRSLYLLGEALGAGSPLAAAEPARDVARAGWHLRIGRQQLRAPQQCYGPHNSGTIFICLCSFWGSFCLVQFLFVVFFVVLFFKDVRPSGQLLAPVRCSSVGVLVLRLFNAINKASSRVSCGTQLCAIPSEQR